MPDLLKNDNSSAQLDKFIDFYQKASKTDTKRLETVTVTPRIAEFLLTTQKINRSLNQATVAKYATMMIRGEWRDSSEIRIDRNGCLVDGQHRLSAISVAQKTFSISLIFGYDLESQAFIDQGKTRTAADISTILGKGYTNQHYAIMRSLVANNQVRKRRKADARLVWGELTTLIEKYKSGIDFALQPIGIRTDMSQSFVFSAVTRAYYHEDNDRLREFLLVYRSGLARDIKKADAALALRNAVHESRRKMMSTGGYQATVFFHRLSLVAIEHFCNGKNIKRLPLIDRDLVMYPLTEIDI